MSFVNYLASLSPVQTTPSATAAPVNNPASPPPPQFQQ